MLFQYCNLDNFTNLQVLYLENNSINKIEGLDKLINLTCLYLQNNYIKEIENLENNIKLSILNLSNNKIQSIPNISYLDKLENLYISKNSLSTIQNLEGLLNLKSLSLLDIQNNPFSVSPDDLITFLNKLEKLKVLYLKGDITRLIPNYRRTLIVKIKNLTYLDDKPIKNEDKVGAEAYFKGGYQAEKEARIKYREENDKVIQIRKREKEMMEISFDERKKLALNSLQLEYNKRKNELENEKDELNKIYQENKDNKKGKRLYNYLSSIDYRIYENEEFKKEEEKLIQLTIAKRERTDQNDIFEYEDWMDDIIQINLLKHCFDFQRALIGIHAIFKQKNVKNYLLFSELDLRSRWTQLEFNKFRKNNDDTFYYLKKEEVYPEDILELMDGKKQEERKEKIKEEKEEKNNKFGINIEEGNVDEDNKDALLIESHNEQKKQDLDELD